MTDEEISMVLCVYMYLNYREADDGMTVNEILSEISHCPDYQEGGPYFGEYTILAQAARNPKVGGLVIGNQSHLMGYDTGTAACTFSARGKKEVYVVYRGTGDGEWPDNGLGMTRKSTLQQERALQYFEEVVEREHISEGQKLIVTGHSKGGNKAQYVTMSTRYQEMLDTCYNFDGQGFSEKAIEGWKNTCTENEYLQRTGKIMGIYGENDYVNVLGNSIVPKGQVKYVKTPVETNNFAGYHDIKYMFASQETDWATGKTVTVFHGSKNAYVENRGDLGNYAALLSRRMMEMEEKDRSGCAAVIMQLMELGGKRKTGLNGERLSLNDIRDFMKSGIPMLSESIFATREGERLLQGILGKNPYTEEIQGHTVIKVNYGFLTEQAGQLSKMADGLEKCEETVRSIRLRLSEAFPFTPFLPGKLLREADALSEARIKLYQLSEALGQVVQEYVRADIQAEEDIVLCGKREKMVE